MPASRVTDPFFNSEIGRSFWWMTTSLPGSTSWRAASGGPLKQMAAGLSSSTTRRGKTSGCPSSVPCSGRKPVPHLVPGRRLRPGFGDLLLCRIPDGVRWVKPRLGLVEFDGSRANNIYQIGRPQAYCPFVDPNEKDPRHKYKSAVGAGKGYGTTTALAYSPDGLHWSYYDQGRPITGRASDTINQVLWDPYSGVYRLYTRTDYGTGGGSGEIRGTRDMVNSWTELRSHPGEWTTVREWCLGRESGRNDYEWTRQIYSLNGWIYEGIQFALLWSLERPGDGEEMDFFLATTRGDRPWNLEWVYRDQPFLPRGPAGSFDSKWIQPAPNIVTWNDKHWIYYVGRPISHSGQGALERPPASAWPRSRWIVSFR